MSAYAVQMPVDGGVNTTYTYDKPGNRLTRTRLGITTNYSYDKADRITQAGLWSMTVNADGNETARGVDSFTHDQANRLVGATTGGVATAFTFDADGKRTTKTTGANQPVVYTYDISNSTPRLVSDGQRKYVYGQELAYEVEPSGSSYAVYGVDGLGSTRALTDGSQTVQQSYTYEEFGTPFMSIGVNSQPFGYSGQIRDGESRLQEMLWRNYDPGVGRFIESDPLRQSSPGIAGWNRFSYVDNNPVRFTDPTGLQLVGECARSAQSDLGPSTRQITASSTFTCIEEELGYVVHQETRIQLFRCTLDFAGACWLPRYAGLLSSPENGCMATHAATISCRGTSDPLDPGTYRAVFTFTYTTASQSIEFDNGDILRVPSFSHSYTFNGSNIRIRSDSPNFPDAQLVAGIGKSRLLL